MNSIIPSNDAALILLREAAYERCLKETGSGGLSQCLFEAITGARVLLWTDPGYYQDENSHVRERFHPLVLIWTRQSG